MSSAAPEPTPRDRLERFFRPSSIAIVGATHGPPAPSYNAYENLKLLGFPGEIYLVNPRYQELYGQPCYPTVTDLPAVPDAVLIMVPARFVPGIVEECGELGVRGVTVYSAGFVETGPAGAALQDEFVASARRHGLITTGGNGLGWLNFNGRSAMYAGSLPRRHGRGNVAVISQSGSGLIALVQAGRQLPLGFVLSSGNEAAFGAAEAIDWLADQPEIDVILMFLETIRNGPGFMAAAAKARAAGKVLAALKTGRTEGGSRATFAHTGAIAGSALAYDAVFKAVGVHRAATVDELVEMGVLFASKPAPPSAPGLGLLTVSGGLLAMYADLAEPVGLRFPTLSQATGDGLLELFEGRIRPSNPLDTPAVYSPDRYARCIEIVAADPGVGAVAVAQDVPPGMGETQTNRYRRVIEAICEAGGRLGKPLFLFTTTHGGIAESIWSDLQQQPFPALFGAAESLRAIAAYFDESEGGRRKAEADGAETEAAVSSSPSDFRLPPSDSVLSERASKALVRAYGVPTPEPLLARSADEAEAVAERLGYPLVAKVESPDVAHKARVGGVRLGVRTAAEARAAYDEILAAVRAALPEARLEGVILEREAPAGLEILVGTWTDPTFGPLLLLGFGGVHAEGLGGQVAAPVPLSRAQAERLLADSPVGRALVKGGHSPAALGRLADLLVGVARLADERRDEIEELDLNPIRFSAPDGEPLALDALVVPRRPAETAGR